MLSKKSLLAAIVPLFVFLISHAQDTLPKFTLLNKGSKRISVSWTNPYGNDIKQLSIQRSYDSLRNFKTILTVPDPTVLQNGYLDTKAITDHMYYRVYIQLDSGKYLFSRSKKPLPDSVTIPPPAPNPVQSPYIESSKSINPALPQASDKSNNGIRLKDLAKPLDVPEKFIYIKRRDSLIGQVSEKNFKKFKDSLVYKTKDTILYNTPDTLVIRAFIPREVYKPSKYVFTEKDGNVRILLPDAGNKKYSLRFLEEDGSTVMEIKHIKEPNLLVDKSNFLHAGWFRFELMEDGQVREKHKLFIPKEF
jgi:hypothetical protein